MKKSPDTQGSFIFLMNTLIDGAMMHEHEILLIIDYTERYFPLPDVYDTFEFENVSYKRWAADEIIQLLCDHPEKDSEFRNCQLVWLIKF